MEAIRGNVELCDKRLLLSVIVPERGGTSSKSKCLTYTQVSLTQTRIIKRNLFTDFLEATSLPVNVPIHRHLEAIR